MERRELDHRFCYGLEPGEGISCCATANQGKGSPKSEHSEGVENSKIFSSSGRELGGGGSGAVDEEAAARGAYNKGLVAGEDDKPGRVETSPRTVAR